ncbi:MAG: hypothetical protein O2931_09055 [Planctomycetota bacterium]|nr:hypothetical protein [Planctomycetota bacterium]MDA1178931.1 hypothetical protein [Planctomycetota bacterium]
MATQNDKWSDALKSVASAVLAIHFICVLVVCTANVSPSQLQARLVKVLAPYTRVLNWDPNFTRFQWTHAVPEHDDHRILISKEDIQKSDASAEVLQFGIRGSLRRARHQALADFMAVYAAPGQELDDVTALIAGRVGNFALRRRNETGSVKVRVDGWEPQLMAPASAANPSTASTWGTIYSAEVWADPGGEVQVLKDAARGEVALPQAPLGTGPQETGGSPGVVTP